MEVQKINDGILSISPIYSIRNMITSLEIRLYPFYVTDGYGEVFASFKTRKEAEDYISENISESSLVIITEEMMLQDIIKHGKINSLIHYQG